MNVERELARYRAMPYRREVDRITDESGTYFVVRYPELPGLDADGESRAAAIVNAAEAFDDYIRARLHFGDPIPEPVGADRIERVLSSRTPKEIRPQLVAFSFQRPAVVNVANGTFEVTPRVGAAPPQRAGDLTTSHADARVLVPA